MHVVQMISLLNVCMLIIRLTFYSLTLSIEMHNFKNFFFMMFRRRLRFKFQQNFKKQIFIIDVQIFVKRVLNLKKNKKKIKKITKVKINEKSSLLLTLQKKSLKAIRLRTRITSTSIKILSMKRINIRKESIVEFQKNIRS